MAVNTFTVAGANTWTAPSNAQSPITVEAWGGGGNGAGRSTTGGGGGGGGGAYARSSVAITPNNIYNYVVGAGGGSGSGGDGLASSFTGDAGQQVIAAGAKESPFNSVTGGAGGTTAASIGATKFAGGSGGTSTGSGMGGGGSGGTASIGNSATTSTGAVAVAGGGPGGNGAASGNAGGLMPASGPGGGGGGARRTSGTQNGGSGRAGQIRLTYVLAYSLIAATANFAFTGNAAPLTNAGSGPQTDRNRRSAAGSPYGLNTSIKPDGNLGQADRRDVVGTYGFQLSLLHAPLTAATGTFAVTGYPVQRTPFTVNRQVFTLNGNNASLFVIRSFTAALGSTSLLGQSVTFPTVVRRIVASQGSFTLTGQPVSLRRAFTMPAAQGSFNFTGVSSALRKQPPTALFAQTGSFLVNGRSIGIVFPLVNKGQFAFTGNPVQFNTTHPVVVSRGTFILTGQAAALRRAFTITATSGNFALTGRIAALSRSFSVGLGSFTLTGRSAIPRQSHALVLNTLLYSVNGQAAIPKHGVIFPVAPGSFSLNGQAETSRTARKIGASVTTFPVLGQVAHLPTSLVLANGSYTFTGRAVNFGMARKIGATGSFDVIGGGTVLFSQPPSRIIGSPGLYSLNGQPATLKRTYTFPVSAGSFQFTGKGVSQRLAVASGSFNVTGQIAILKSFSLSKGTYSINGMSVNLTRSEQAAYDFYSLTGFDAGFGIKMPCATGNFALNGQAVIFPPKGSVTLAGVAISLDPILGFKLRGLNKF